MVYIDNANIPYLNMIMCHMIADTTEELLAMAKNIGVDKKWLQDAGTYQEHFDICMAKKKKALASGAKEISKYELGRITLNRAKQWKSK